MAKNDKDNANSAVVSKKERIVNVLVFIGLALGAVIMVFPLIYMVMTSFIRFCPVSSVSFRIPGYSVSTAR